MLEWPSTFDTGKLGISLYGISTLSVTTSASGPSPEPKIIAISGVMLICSLIYFTD